MRHKIHQIPACGALLSLLLFSACATDEAVRSRLPAPASMNQCASRPSPLVVMLGLQSGEKLPFLLDTGAPVTCLDKTLEPRLGRRLGTVTAVNFGVEHDVDVFEAPQLYLGSTPLTMTGTNVVTFDFKQAPPNIDRPYVGILGMHVLLNYCIQLDFSRCRIRFLAADAADRTAWGTPLPLTDVGDGCVTIDQNLMGAKGPGSLIDTGYRSDGFLTPELFDRWTNRAIVPPDGETRSPNTRLGGEIYPDVHLKAEMLSTGDPPRQLNGIGLGFLSRHLVTFDFPNRTLYLKRTSVGPLIDAATKAAANELIRSLVRLKRRGQLPGWSKKDAFGNKRETIQLSSLNRATFHQIRKQGDSSIYHYEFCRSAQDLPWRLQKAWRTDENGHTIEEYPVLDPNGAGTDQMQQP